MAVGCLIYMNKEGKVFHRLPCWPWPAPGVYPQKLEEGGYVQFFPASYLRFALGDIVKPFPPQPYTPLFQGVAMKTLARNIPLTLAGRQYVCDIILGIYANTERPAIMLAESCPESMSPQSIWDGAPIAVASTNAPEEYIAHLPKPHFPAKDWTENEGLWEQLLQVMDEDGSPLFMPTRWAITLGFCKAVIMILGPSVLDKFEDLRDEKHRASQQGVFHG